MNMRARLLLISSIASGLCACNDERTYVGDDGVYQVALSDATPAAYQGEDEDDALYIVEQRAELPIRRPSNTELSDLMSGASRYTGLPFPRLPWVARGDLELQIDFTLSNLDDEEHEVAVTLNGVSEFYEYMPGVQIIDEAAVPDYAQWEKLYKVGGKQRIRGTIREEDLDEAAVDLATVVNGAPNSNQIVFFENKSGSDPRSKPYVPKVIPGLVGFRIGMRATEAGNLLVEATARVRDVGDRLAEDGDRLLEIDPEPFMPVVPEADE
jgi:hypothetical protein